MALNWIRAAQDTDNLRDVVNTVMNTQVQQNEEKLLTLKAVSFSRMTPLHVVSYLKVMHYCLRKLFRRTQDGIYIWSDEFRN
jgi:hypothetical protein